MGVETIANANERQKWNRQQPDLLVVKMKNGRWGIFRTWPDPVRPNCYNNSPFPLAHTSEARFLPELLKLVSTHHRSYGPDLETFE